jgi:glutathione S-transferase
VRKIACRWLGDVELPRLKAYYERCLARPAWQHTLALYAERLGVSVDAVR